MGTYTVTATVAVDANNNSASSAATAFEIDPGSATELMVTLPGQTFAPVSGNSGTISSQTAGVAFDITLTVVDSGTNIVTSFPPGPYTVTYSGPDNSPSGTAPIYTTSVTFSGGQATLLPTTLFDAETTTITANVSGITGIASSNLTVNPSAATTIALTSGNDQSGTVNTALGSPFLVTVTDEYSNGVPNTSVTFAVATTPVGATGQSLSTVNGTTDVNGQSPSTLTLGNVQGTYTVTATSGTLSGSPLTFTATTPETSATAFVRGTNAELRIPISSILAPDSDPNPNGYTLTLAGVSSSTAGVTLYTNASFVLYTMSPDTDPSSDTFQYTVSDGHGGTAVGTVTVTIRTYNGETANFVSYSIDGSGNPTMTFAGIPGFSYNIQSSSVMPFSWTTLTTEIASSTDGLFDFTDMTVTEPGTTIFYRAINQ